MTLLGLPSGSGGFSMGSNKAASDPAGEKSLGKLVESYLLM